MLLGEIGKFPRRSCCPFLGRLAVLWMFAKIMIRSAMSDRDVVGLRLDDAEAETAVLADGGQAIATVFKGPVLTGEKAAGKP